MYEPKLLCSSMSDAELETFGSLVMSLIMSRKDRFNLDSAFEVKCRENEELNRKVGELEKDLDDAQCTIKNDHSITDALIKARDSARRKLYKLSRVVNLLAFDVQKCRNPRQFLAEFKAAYAKCISENDIHILDNEEMCA